MTSIALDDPLAVPRESGSGRIEANNAPRCSLDAISDGHDLVTCLSAAPLRLQEVLARFHREAKSGYCDTERYRCRYHSWGDGPPLLFIHGLGDDALSFIMPCARLSERFRCITYDLPRGDGDGARLSRYRHTDLVADLFALIDHLGLGPTFLFGSSFGSTIALAAMRDTWRVAGGGWREKTPPSPVTPHTPPATHHPSPTTRFPRCVLQGGFARRPLAFSEIMLADWARYWECTMDHLPWRLAVMRHVHYAPFAAREPDVWQFFLERDGSNPIRAVARRALILSQLDLRPLLPDIRQPVLIVCGDHDPLVNKRCERELLAGLPNVGRAELAGCGHIPAFTHPEALAEIVRRFLLPLAA